MATLEKAKLMNVDTNDTWDVLFNPKEYSVQKSVLTGLEPGMWSGHRPGSTASYRRWTYAWNYHDEPQVVGGVPLSGLSRARYPELPSVLRFRYAGAPLWWAAPKTDEPIDPEHGSSRGARAMRAGLQAANSAAAIWRSILVASAAQEDATGGMDTRREASAEEIGRAHV